MDDEIDAKQIRIDAQGWWRTIVVIVSLVIGVLVTYYVGREDMKAEHTKMQADIAVLKSVRVRSTEEISEVFVTRREWENENKNLKSDLNYLRQKIDVIYEHVVQGRK